MTCPVDSFPSEPPCAPRAGVTPAYENLAALEQKFVPARSPWQHWGAVVGRVGALLTAVLALACSSGEGPPQLGNGVPSRSNYRSGPCEAGAEHHCSATLNQANGAITCWEGKQVCEDGVWGPCLGELTVRAEPSGLRQSTMDAQQFAPLSLSTPVPCENNPCDPYCMLFDEVPEDDITGSGGPGAIPDWSGDPGYMPPARQPCYSGLDCQVNSRCTEVLTGGSCAHSKCLTGAALDANCDPCVARVCSDMPSCCSSGWTEACVERVKTVCDAWCGEIVSGCAHNVCTQGGPLSAGCSTCVSTVCSTPGLGYCCTSAWDAACIAAVHTECGTGFPPVARVCDYAVMAGGAIAMYGATVRGGDMGGGTGANMISADGPRSLVEGNVYSHGTMQLSGADVTGNVAVTGPLAYWPCPDGGTWCSEVGGTMCQFCSVPNVPVPTKSLTCPPGGANQNFATNGTLSPGNYGDVNVTGGTLTLQAGVYNLNSLTLSSNTRIALPASGVVEVNVCGRVYFGSGTQVSGASSGSDALRFQVYSASNGTDPTNCSINAVCIDVNSTIYGVFTAPSGGGFVGENSTLYGFVHAAQANLKRNSLVDAGGATGDACRIATSPCPVTTPPPVVAEQGDCVPNALGFTDGTCATPDLAVELPCSNEVTVCNHGTVDAPAGATLTFYPRAAQQFATTSPNAADALGSCTVTSPVPAGGCTTEVCDAALMSEDVTIRVSTSGTECSALDNWSLYEPGSCSGGVVTEIYEATCDDPDTSPRWGLLSWDATTPGDSSITWRARVADTVAQLGSAPFIDLGVTQRVPDTQICSPYDGPAGCPVDLSGNLWTTDNERKRHQPEVLELQITLNSSGGDNPVLRNWKVTYSCLYDQ